MHQDFIEQSLIKEQTHPSLCQDSQLQHNTEKPAIIIIHSRVSLSESEVLCRSVRREVLSVKLQWPPSPWTSISSPNPGSESAPALLQLTSTSTSPALPIKRTRTPTILNSHLSGKHRYVFMWGELLQERFYLGVRL